MAREKVLKDWSDLRDYTIPELLREKKNPIKENLLSRFSCCRERRLLKLLTIALKDGIESLESKQCFINTPKIAAENTAKSSFERVKTEIL